MAETVGSLADKIIISQLKIFHTREQMERPDADAALRELCGSRLEVLGRQSRDLQEELSHLFRDIREGRYQPKVYRQFKMYNDPRFQMKK